MSHPFHEWVSAFNIHQQEKLCVVNCVSGMETAASDEFAQLGVVRGRTPSAQFDEQDGTGSAFESLDDARIRDHQDYVGFTVEQALTDRQRRSVL